MNDATRREPRPGSRGPSNRVPIDPTLLAFAVETEGDSAARTPDRCNLRCSYCMPEEQYAWLPHDDILRFEEISFLVDVFAELGAAKVRLTGGEPLLRRDLRTLVRFIADKPRIRDIAMTTNGVLLAQHVHGLRAAGLRRLTVSLDTTRRAAPGHPAEARRAPGDAHPRRVKRSAPRAIHGGSNFYFAGRCDPLERG